VKYRFICKKCGKEKEIEDPVKASIECRCGGAMKMSITQPTKESKDRSEPEEVNPHDARTTLMGLILNRNDKGRDTDRIGEKLFRFKTVMCPKCGWIQVTEGKKRFKCRQCNRSSKYRVGGTWHVKLEDFPSHETAMRYAKKWRKKKHDSSQS